MGKPTKCGLANNPGLTGGFPGRVQTVDLGKSGKLRFSEIRISQFMLPSPERGFDFSPY